MIHDVYVYPRPGVFIHPMAVVHDDCEIGAGTRIWQFASILRGAKLGKDCNVASGACFDGSRADDRVVICHNLAAGPGFWLQDDVFIGPNCTLCNDSWPRATKEGFHPEAFDGTRWAIVIEKGATIGAGVVVLPGVRIGAGAMVPADVTVSRDVPAGHLMMPNQVPIPISSEADKLGKRMRFTADAVRTPTWTQSPEAAR